MLLFLIMDCSIIQLNYIKILQFNSDEIFTIKGIVHFEINFWYVLAYLKGIQDVGVFVSKVFSILTFFDQTILVY